MIELVVPMAPAPALLPNKARTVSHHVWGREAKDLKDTAIYAIRDQLPHNWKTIDTPVLLMIYVAWGRRRNAIDLDGTSTAVKSAIDALKLCGVIVDDGPKYVVELFTTQGKDPTGRGFIRIRIQEPINLWKDVA